MRTAWAIGSYLLGCLLLGAAFSPALYYAGHALGTAYHPLGFLAESDLQRYFNRAVLLAAFALLVPLLRTVGVGHWRGLGFAPNPHRWRDLFGGFLLAAGVMATLGCALLAAGIYHPKNPLPLALLPRVLLTAISVALLEEGLFRGLILGAVRRTARPVAAAAFVSALFAVLHFVKPSEAPPGEVRWFSGWALLPQVFKPFAEPDALLAGFVALFILGALLAHAALRTRSLWLPIGLHAGLVFGKMGFNKLAKRVRDASPWFGPDLTVGLGAVTVLLCLWLLCWYLFLRERSPAPLVGHPD